MKNSISSLYVHIPFCNKICSYCDFCKIYYDKKYIDKYLDTLEFELKNKYKSEILNTIYIGGGTPSTLSINELEKLFIILSKCKLNKNYEYTIEVNADSLSYEKLDLFKKYKINRISIGIESINKDNLLFMNRELDKEKLIKLINYSNKIGISNINADLIYALICENMDILKKDLEFICSLNIKHISTYSLEINKNTIIGNMNLKPIDEDIDYDMYKYICDYLKNNGFIHYEISNFCKFGYESCHNLVYWNNENYYGIGLGASSYINNKRIDNTRSLNKYFNLEFVKNVEILDKNSIIMYEIMLNLRKCCGISLDKFYKKYNKQLYDMYDYSDLVNRNLLIEEKGNLYIPEDKLYIQNNIILMFLNAIKE